MSIAVGDARYRAVRRVLQITLLANLLVVAAKIVAGLLAHSLSVLADAAHSSVDALNNVMALIVTRLAAKEPDAEHPYGHAKFETLGALVIVGLLSITVYQLVRSAIERLLVGGAQAEATPLALGVMLVSAVVNLLVTRYEQREGQRLRSDILQADAAHTRSDVYSSLAVVGALGLVRLGFPQFDAIVTFLVAIVIARAGWRILQTTVPILVDERATSEEAIARIARSAAGVRNCFSVRSRGRAGEVFAELTITVDRALNVEEAHRIADEVERAVAAALDAREVVVHVEPDNNPA
jgi:cation diffusion facilitator family transporter